MTENSDLSHRIAIGGIGGSGTRVGAVLLQLLGLYIGGDLNSPLDNLWFTLLFKRRSVLMESGPDFVTLVELFWSRMSGMMLPSDRTFALVTALASESRLQHDREWLQKLAQSLLTETRAGHGAAAWGWKEPNTHIVVERMFKLLPDLRYIHFSRHPLDMAFSDNQSQLENWGPILLNRDIEIRPRDSLAYWCAAERRIARFMRRYPDRTLAVDFDKLCSDPAGYCARIADFIGVQAPDRVHSEFTALVDSGRPGRGRFKSADLKQFDPEDIAYVHGLGYDLK
jgi:hypothetical protein